VVEWLPLKGQRSCANAVGRQHSDLSFLAHYSCPKSHVRWGIGGRKFTARGLNVLPLTFLTQKTCQRVESYLTRDIKKYKHMHSVSRLLINLLVRSVSFVRCLLNITTHVHQKFCVKVKIKVNHSRYRPGVVQRVPGS